MVHAVADVQLDPDRDNVPRLVEAGHELGHLGRHAVRGRAVLHLHDPVAIGIAHVQRRPEDVRLLVALARDRRCRLVDLQCPRVPGHAPRLSKAAPLRRNARPVPHQFRRRRIVPVRRDVLVPVAGQRHHRSVRRHLADAPGLDEVDVAAQHPIGSRTADLQVHGGNDRPAPARTVEHRQDRFACSKSKKK